MTTNSWAMLYGTVLIATIALVRGDSFTPQWTFSYLSALLYLAIFGSVSPSAPISRWSDALVPVKRHTVHCFFHWWR